MRDLKVGEEATVRGVVERVAADRTARKRVAVVRAVVRDQTGAIEATWFNQGYLTRVLEPGMRLSVRGTYRPRSGHATFLVRGHEILDDEEGGHAAHGGHRAGLPGERTGLGAPAAHRGAARSSR